MLDDVGVEVAGWKTATQVGASQSQGKAKAKARGRGKARGETARFSSFLCLQVLKIMLYSTRELGASWNLIEKITCEEGFVASRTGQSVARVRLHVGQPCHLQGAELILRLQGLIQNKLDPHTL